MFLRGAGFRTALLGTTPVGPAAIRTTVARTVIGPAISGAAQLLQGALEGFNFPLVAQLLAFGQFDQFQHFLHLFHRVTEFLDDFTNLFHRLADGGLAEFRISPGGTPGEVGNTLNQRQRLAGTLHRHFGCRFKRNSRLARGSWFRILRKLGAGVRRDVRPAGGPGRGQWLAAARGPAAPASATAATAMGPAGGLCAGRCLLWLFFVRHFAEG
jgi:hypothetical protein